MMNQRKNQRIVSIKKNVKCMISIVCLIALCLRTVTVSDAAEAEQWVYENGVIFTEVSPGDPDRWGVCGYDESLNKVGNITIESSYLYFPGSKQIVAIMHYKADDGTITGAFEKKILPAVKITSGTDGYPISTRSFFGSTIQGDFLFQDHKNALIGASSFSNTKFNSNVTFHLTDATLYENVFKDATVAGNINILGTIDTIKAYAFSGLVVEGDFRMTGIIANIESYALANSRFSEFYLSDSLQTMGSHIFDGCEKLRKIKLPRTDCVKTVAPDAFPNEKGLTISIPEGLTDLSVFHLKNYPNVLFQTETELPPDSPVLQYLKENNLMYQQGEDGEIIMPENPVQTEQPSSSPTAAPSTQPTAAPATQSTAAPSTQPTAASTAQPAATPTAQPATTPATQSTALPTQAPVSTPTTQPTAASTAQPTATPAAFPITRPSTLPTQAPVTTPATQPTATPSTQPTAAPATQSTSAPSTQPTSTPAIQSTSAPSTQPTFAPATQSTAAPTTQSTAAPTATPATQSTAAPNTQPMAASTAQPTAAPAASPAKKRAPATVTIKKIKYRITGKNSVKVLGTTDKKLKKLRIPDTVTINGTLYKVVQIEKKAFKKQKKLKSAVIGNYITKIGNEAFASCKNLGIVQFGTRLQILGKKVLYNDKKLKKITFKGEKLKKIGNKTFSGVSRGVDIRAVRAKAESYSRLINRSKT